MDAIIALDESQPGLAALLEQVVTNEQLNARTRQTYLHWISQYIAYYDLENPSSLSTKNVKEFLRHLVIKLPLSRAKRNQAKEALIFLYAKVLKQPMVTQGL